MLEVVDSTFYENYALDGWGAAIYNTGGYTDGVLTVTNSTFVGNTADYGGAIYSEAAYNGATGEVLRNVTLNNDLFSNNTGGSCDYQDAMSFTGSNNLADDASCGAAGFTLSTSMNLGPLGYNGGPTPTVPLLPGSAAIHAGSDAVCAATPVNNLDQRVARPQGAHCDIGAYEYYPPRVTQTFMIIEPSLAGYPILRTYVYFTSQNGPFSWTIDFGDGTLVAGWIGDQNGDRYTCDDSYSPNHIYTNPGTYTLAFTIRDNYGAETTGTIQHTVIEDPNPGPHHLESGACG